METKPRLKMVAIAGRPVSVPVSKVEEARRRFGKKFAHDSGSEWKPRATRFLTDWLASRITEKA